LVVEIYLAAGMGYEKVGFLEFDEQFTTAIDQRPLGGLQDLHHPQTIFAAATGGRAGADAIQEMLTFRPQRFLPLQGIDRFIALLVRSPEFQMGQF
jgi:hypothetical protein